MPALDWRLRLLELYGTRLPHPGQERVHKWLREKLDVRPTGARAVRRRGFRWTLDPSDLAHHDLFWFGESDRWDLLQAKKLVRPGAVILDVGANIGYLAIQLASSLNKQCSVYAFEPFPTTFRLLVKHVTDNGMDRCVYPQELALSAEAGSGTIHEWVGDQTNSGAATLGEGSDRSGGAQAAGVTVSVSSMDLFCGANPLSRVDFVKIDTEGFEERVPRGATGTLDKWRPSIMLELNPRMLSRAGSSPERVVQLLEKSGYDLFQSRRARLVPLTDMPPDGEYMNAFAIHRSRR